MKSLKFTNTSSGLKSDGNKLNKCVQENVFVKICFCSKIMANLRIDITENAIFCHECYFDLLLALHSSSKKIKCNMLKMFY